MTFRVRLATALFIPIICCLSVLTAPAIAASSDDKQIELIDENGRSITRLDLLGKPAIILFGFTSCPSICPTSLAELTRHVEALGPLADKLNVFFVTGDPERDTPELLREYTAYFHDDIVGLTGTRANIDKLAKSLGAVIRKVPQDGGRYTIDHTVFAFLMDSNWQRTGVLVLDPNADFDRLNAKLKELTGSTPKVTH